jgi:hypothetical protein
MLAAAGALLVLAALAPAAATADRAHYAIDPGYVSRFEFHGSNGYLISVSANDRGYITVKARKDGAEAEYVAAGRASGLGGSAVLPGLGRVSFALRPTGPPRHFAGYPGCEGEWFVRDGVARGIVRFRGERGYTRARAHRARAEVIYWPGQRCHYLRAGRGKAKRRPVARLTGFRFQRPLVEFTATRFAPRDRPRSRRIGFDAKLVSYQPGMRILRTVSVAAGPRSFRVPEAKTAPENIVLAPPRPFRGRASMRRTPESTFVWAGSLRVAFPGTRPIGLHGRDFATQYCALRGCIEQFPENSPFRRLRLPSRQGSGRDRDPGALRQRDPGATRGADGDVAPLRQLDRRPGGAQLAG